MSEHVGIELDDDTARWLHGCARMRGVDVAAAAAAQLREDRAREGEEYILDALAERDAAQYA